MARGKLSQVLREIADELDKPSTSAATSVAVDLNQSTSSAAAQSSTGSAQHIHPVDAEVARLFRPYKGRPLSRRQTFGQLRQPCSYTHTFCCLSDKNAESVPTRQLKRRLSTFGLGEKRVTYRGNHKSPDEFKRFLLEAYPKLRQGGGFELLRIAGTTKSRQLSIIPCPREGYDVNYLKDPQTQIGHATVFIRPLQRNLDMDNEPEAEICEEVAGPPQECMTCGAEFPFATIKFHSDECLRKSQDSEQVVCEGGPESPCSSTSEGRPRQSSSSTSEGRPRQSSSSTSEGRPLRSSGQPETDNSINLVPSQGNELYSHIIDLDSIEEREPDDWKNEPNPAYAAKKFRDSLLQKHETGKPLHLQMDLRDTPADRERAILSFYKMANIDWACPLSCTLKGDPAIGDGVMRHFFETIMSKIQHGFEINFMPGGTLLFEGEKDHLIPSTSQLLFESDFFLVAGRMMGHSFLHEGPTFAGLSPAIMHVLFGGSPETTTIEIADCADTDVRDLISMLESSKELAAEDKTKITELAVSWDLPALTSQNRMWLHDKLLYHAVIGRTWKQVKQLRRGLKETLIWPLLTERKDTIPFLFPRSSDMQFTPEMILEKVNWPVHNEDSEVNLEDQCRLTEFLRRFIENSSSNILHVLLRFWVGWSMLPRYLDVEVVECTFPKSNTCFHLLKLPGHYKEYLAFEKDLLAAVWSTDSGFGLI